MKLKSKKSALLLSFTSLLLCFAMLAGSTFAWFTDTATTGVNRIQSGTLDVGLEMATEWDDAGNPTKWDNAEGKTLKWQKKATAEAEAEAQILWEPGCTYKLPELRVVNNGNLALKYKVVITGIQGDAKLNKAIKWTIDDAPISLVEKELLAKKQGAAFTIKGHMDENAGNEYQNLTIDGIAITVYATQDTVENDSYGPTYDENATYYPVLDAAGLKDALVNGGNIKVDNSFDAGEDTLAVNKDTVLDMNGKTISNTADIWDERKGDWSLISARNGANLTITGNGTFKAKENDAMAVDVQSGATVTIKNGTFVGNVDAVYVEIGTAIIEGGHFSIQQLSQHGDYRYLLNCYDANYKNGSAKIIVKGGTFVNFDPSNNAAEGAGTNFVAEGYSVISEQHGADTWYTVVKGQGATASTQEALNNAIQNNTSATATVKLTEAGTYTLPGMSGKDVTIVGTKDTVIDVSTGSTHHGATIALEGVTVKGQTSGDFQGLQHTDKVVYKNCKITGKQTLYANDVEFVNCEFDSGADYALWTYGAKNVTFTDCEFNSTNKGKSVLCYSVLKDQTFTRTFNRCTFIATGTKDKSAIMINPTESGGGTNTYIVNINDCTATGYAENGISGQTIVGLRNAGAGVIDTITVTINGTTVYTH